MFQVKTATTQSINWLYGMNPWINRVGRLWSPVEKNTILIQHQIAEYSNAICLTTWWNSKPTWRHILFNYGHDICFVLRMYQWYRFPISPRSVQLNDNRNSTVIISASQDLCTKFYVYPNCVLYLNTIKFSTDIHLSYWTLSQQAQITNIVHGCLTWQDM